MILVNKNSKIVLDVLRAELTPKSDLLDTIDSLDYTVTFGMQVKKSSANLRHRDILNPVFNEVRIPFTQRRPSSSSQPIVTNLSSVFSVAECSSARPISSLLQTRIWRILWGAGESL